MTIEQITAALDDQIAFTTAELERLTAARLALTVAPVGRASDAPAKALSPRPDRAAHRTRGRKRQPKLTVESCIDGVRDAIADGPKKMSAIHQALGRSPSPASKNVVRQALEQLRAVQIREGWQLPLAAAVPAAPSVAPVPPPPLDRTSFRGRVPRTAALESRRGGSAVGRRDRPCDRLLGIGGAHRV